MYLCFICISIGKTLHVFRHLSLEMLTYDSMEASYGRVQETAGGSEHNGKGLRCSSISEALPLLPGAGDGFGLAAAPHDLGAKVS